MFTAAQAVSWIRASAAVIEENATALTKLDAAIGDGDHGTNMNRGFKAALQRLDGLEATDFGGVFKAVGMALISMVARGKAQLEDKTMLDAWHPALEALDAALAGGGDLGAALDQAEQAAEAGMKATIPLVARKGRASYLGERSRDHQDPGATSTHLLVKALADVVNER